jgi:hypothetical protein
MINICYLMLVASYLVFCLQSSVLDLYEMNLLSLIIVKVHLN